MPRVSIIMPAFHAERTIGQAIESVLTQTIPDWELLICDDASNDQTAKVAAGFDDPRIRVLRNEGNLGPGPSRDRLIEMARAPWVTALDADDVYVPERLESLLAAASQHPDAVWFDEIMECHDTPQGLLPWKPVRPPELLSAGDGKARIVDIARWLSGERTMMQWMAPAQLIAGTGARHPTQRFGEDLGFVLQLLGRSNARLGYVPQALYRYRLGSGSLTTSPERFGTLHQILLESRSLFEDRPNVVEAIDHKIRQVATRMTYQVFLSALVRGEVLRAARQATRHPWVVPEFMVRALKHIPYHLSRLHNAGSYRETS